MSNKDKLDKIEDWKKSKPKTDEEWAEDVKEESLQLKWDKQLDEMLVTCKEKKVWADKKRDLLNKYPEGVKKEVEEFLLSRGDGFTLEGRDLDEFVEDEAQQKIDYANWKANKLDQSIERLEKEKDLREKKAVKRKPIGTTYYVDFDNGSDSTNDGSTPTKSNGDGPFATLEKFTQTTRSAGDVCIVRRGMVQTVSADMTFVGSGTTGNPIILEADFGDSWSDFADSAQTYTPVWGATTMTASATITGISVGDWVYNLTDGDDQRDFSYEVKAVSGTTLTLYLPWKGSVGAAKTLKVMPANPIWNLATGNYMANIERDYFWFVQGLHFRGTDSYGQLEMDSVVGTVKDCIFEGNGPSDYGIRTDDDAYITVLKCRIYNNVKSYRGAASEFKDCYFDGNSVSYAAIMDTLSTNFIKIEESITSGMAYDITTPAQSPANCNGNLVMRNVRYSGTTANVYEPFRNYPPGLIGVEDEDGVPGVSKQFNFFSDDDDLPVINSDTTDVRAGGGATSIKVLPDGILGTIRRDGWGKILVFEYPIYADTSEKTFTAYFKSDDDTDWDADPTAAELWIEVEYWGHATNKYRKIVRSTGVCDSFDSDDTVWNSLSVTVTPAIAGVLYLRCYYAKAKEAAKANIFFADTKIEVT